MPEYNAMVAELEAGLSLAVEVTRDATVQQDLRAFCGPAGELTCTYRLPATACAVSLSVWLSLSVSILSSICLSHPLSSLILSRFLTL